METLEWKLLISVQQTNIFVKVTLHYINNSVQRVMNVFISFKANHLTEYGMS